MPSAIIVRRFHVSDAIRTPSRHIVSNIDSVDPIGSSTLEREHQRDPAVGQRRVEIGRGLHERDIARVQLGDLVGELDQLERAPQRTLTDELLLGEDREHLEHDAARPEPGQPEVAERVADAPLALVEAREQQVVVRIGDGQEVRHGAPPLRPAARRP